MKKVSGIYALLNELTRCFKAGDSRTVQMLGASESLVQILLQGLAQSEEIQHNLVLVFPHQKDIFLWQDTIKSLFQSSQVEFELCLLPYYLVWGPEKYINHSIVRQDKLRTLYNLLQSPKRKIVLTTLPALAQQTLTQERFLAACTKVDLHTSFDLDEFTLQMAAYGYQQTQRVEEKGFFSIRGGIVDIFPLQEARPLRLELLGDSVQSLRYFSPETQISEEATTQVVVAPCAEVLIPSGKRQEKAQVLYDYLLEENIAVFEIQALMASFDNSERLPILDALTFQLLEDSQPAIDYLNDRNLFIFPHSMERCLQALHEFFETTQHLFLKDKEGKHAVSKPEKVFLASKILIEKLEQFPTLEFENPLERPGAQIFRWSIAKENALPAKDLDKHKRRDAWLSLFEKTIERGGAVVIPCDGGESSREAARLALGERFEDPKFEANILSAICRGRLKANAVLLTNGFVTAAIQDEEQNVLIVPQHELTGGRRRSAVASNRKLKNLLSSFRDLSIDDLVVHLDHGIGRYKGMTQIEVQGFKGDFLILEYRGGDRVYLPVDRLNLLQKYKKAEGNAIPVLDKLGGDGFKIRKAKVERSILEVADELIKVHAERKLLRSQPFSAPGDIFERFVEDFPYQETVDQLRCLDEVEGDLRGGHPMDRLVVGDVGFGKTEIALRAALRAILEGFQVMFLVPTTVLCYQHFYNFSFRLEKWGVRLGQAHRLIKRSKQKEIFDDFESGKLDLLLGTHRILSKDVRPKNLGLLIVDEEQRFGVMQKEKFKQLKANIDILTLSATPIPRTLHMAMLGLRDISLITTPPANRMAVRTVVSPFDERVIKTAIESEVLRGGQVFYVHNRVEDLAQRGEELKKLVPSAKIRTAHGQMHEESLDKIIIDFIEQKFNVLVCTTIIESGVDMPNVNTLIVENAQAFGLSQLYQLRGRVGRSSIQAYAYLLVKKAETLTPEAMKRLEVLAAHQELGAGFQIANYDLEFRGAGNLIGKQQSGQIASVGFEMYVEMLEEKIKELSSVKVDRKFDPEIKIKVTALIPSWYITDERERLDLYKRLFSAAAGEEISEIQKTTEDIYGKMPLEFSALVQIAQLRVRLRLLGVGAIIELDRNRYELRFFDPSKEKKYVRLHGLLPSDTEGIRLDKLLKGCDSF